MNGTSTQCSRGFDQAVLLDYVEGRLDRDGSLSVEEHVRDCAECRGTLHELSTIHAVLIDTPEGFHLTADELYLAAVGTDIPDHVSDHLGSCEPCRRELDVFREMLAAAVPQPTLGDLPPMVEESFRRAHPRQTERKSSEASTIGDFLERVRRFFTFPTLAMGTAAAVILILVLLLPQRQLIEEQIPKLRAEQTPVIGSQSPREPENLGEPIPVKEPTRREKSKLLRGPAPVPQEIAPHATKREIVDAGSAPKPSSLDAVPTTRKGPARDEPVTSGYTAAPEPEERPQETEVSKRSGRLGAWDSEKRLSEPSAPAPPTFPRKPVPPAPMVYGRADGREERSRAKRDAPGDYEGRRDVKPHSAPGTAPVLSEQQEIRARYRRLQPGSVTSAPNSIAGKKERVPSKPQARMDSPPKGQPLSGGTRQSATAPISVLLKVSDRKGRPIEGFSYALPPGPADRYRIHRSSPEKTDAETFADGDDKNGRGLGASEKEISPAYEVWVEIDRRDSSTVDLRGRLVDGHSKRTLETIEILAVPDSAAESEFAALVSRLLEFQPRSPFHRP